MCAKALTRLADHGDYIKHGDLFLWVFILMQALMFWAMAKALAVWALQIYGWRKWWIVDLVRVRLGKRKQKKYWRTKANSKSESYAVKR